MTKAHLFEAVLAVLLAAGLFLRGTLFARLPVRRMRWRTLFRLRPGQGYATYPELWLRWGRISAIWNSRRTMPALGWTRWITPAPYLAHRIGRGPLFRRCYIDEEKQTLYVAPPRSGKTGMLGDQVISHRGPALIHETRPNMYQGTAGWRAQLGPIQIFNPDGTGGIPSTFRWAMTSGCADPTEALYRASDLVGAVADTGEMQWWSEKARGSLAGAIHAAGLTYDDPVIVRAAALAAGIQGAALVGGTMTDVFDWAYGAGASLITEAKRHPGASQALFGALTELDRPGKTADSIRITMSKSLEWLAVPALRDMVTGPGAAPFDIGDWIASCGTIYMISPGGEQAPSAPLFRCFTSYARRQAIALAAYQPHQRLEPGVLFALDELDKCPVDLPRWFADSGGSGVQVTAVIHSTGQLRDKYGDAGLDTCWNTAGNKIFLPGNHNARTLQDLSVLGGTLPHGEARGLNPIVTVEFIARLPNWRCLVFSGNLAPNVVKFRPYWKRLRARLGRAPRPPLVFGTRIPRALDLRSAATQGHNPGDTTQPLTLPAPVYDTTPEADDAA
jgi:type IV secretion system protein VirD4